MKVVAALLLKESLPGSVEQQQYASSTGLWEEMVLQKFLQPQKLLQPDRFI